MKIEMSEKTLQIIRDESSEHPELMEIILRISAWTDVEKVVISSNWFQDKGPDHQKELNFSTYEENDDGCRIYGGIVYFPYSKKYEICT